MTDGAVMRTEYWNISTGTVRTGATGHGESLTDMESYLLPADQARGAALYSWGVAAGLAVQGTAGAPGVTVLPGTALDAAGQLIMLPVNGTVIVDPAVDPAQLQDVPTVLVGAAGITLATTGPAADCLLTLTWREVADVSTLANAPVLLHAPWLRLIPAAGFADNGDQVVLAEVTLDDNGNLTGLSAGLRRQVGIPAGRVELRVPRLQDGTAPVVDHRAAAELAADENGDVAISLLSGPAPVKALTIDGVTGEVALSASLTASPALRVSAVGGRTYQLSAGPEGSWHFTDATANADRLVVDPAGNVGIGIGAGQAQRTVHIEGSEVHSGGPSGGFSFADRATGSFVNNPGGTGSRWVWYAQDHLARLWSGSDQLTVSTAIPGDGTGLTVARRMRVQQGPDGSAGIWFQQQGTGDNAFVGMADGTHVGFWGNTGARWGLQMDTGTGEVDVSRRMRVRQGGDASAGIWFLQGGPNADRGFVGMADDTHVGFWGNTGAGWGLKMDTGTGEVDVASSQTAVVARGGSGPFAAGVRATGNVGVWAASDNTGLLASGSNLAGQFMGHVRMSADLDVSGTISKGGGGFRIDHPSDPAGRYLSHSFVESPEMLNVYAGTAVTGDDSEVTVTLPGYFAALNRDHRFQLTPVGQLALATVDGGVRENRFTIRTDRPGVTVCWQVTGVRQDKWAEAHRIRAEEDKAEGDRGRFLHPEAHGQPAAMSLYGAGEQPG